jgi:hypothetical protein
LARRAHTANKFLFGGLVFAGIIVILLTKPFYDGVFR